MKWDGGIWRRRRLTIGGPKMRHAPGKSNDNTTDQIFLQKILSTKVEQNSSSQQKLTHNSLIPTTKALI